MIRYVTYISILIIVSLGCVQDSCVEFLENPNAICLDVDFEISDSGHDSIAVLYSESLKKEITIELIQLNNFLALNPGLQKKDILTDELGRDTIHYRDISSLKMFNDGFTYQHGTDEPIQHFVQLFFIDEYYLGVEIMTEIESGNKIKILEKDKLLTRKIEKQVVKLIDN